MTTPGSSSRHSMQHCCLAREAGLATELSLTRHSEVRLSQRGLQDTDIAFLMDAAPPPWPGMSGSLPTPMSTEKSQGVSGKFSG
jgi:hypothetical protein